MDEVEHVELEAGVDGKRDPTEVHLNEFFGIIDLAGKLMNKAEPDSDDEGPYDEFQKWEHTDIIEGHDGEEDCEIDYIRA